MTSVFPPWSDSIFYDPGAFVSYLNVSYQATALQPNVLQEPDISPTFWTVYGTPTNSVSSVNAGQGITVTGGQTSSPTIAANLVATGAGIGLANGTGTAINVSNTGVTSAIGGTGVSVSSATGAVTFANTGVTSAIGGTGVSVSSATGAVTFGNTGVTSVIAGSNVTVSSATGAVTISSTASGGFTPTTQVLLAQGTLLNGATGFFPTPTLGAGLYLIMGCAVPATTSQSRQAQFCVSCYVNGAGRVQMGGAGIADVGGIGGNDEILIFPQDGTSTFYYNVNTGGQSLVNYSIVAFKISGPVVGAF